MAAGSQARLVEWHSKRKRCGVEMRAHSTNRTIWDDSVHMSDDPLAAPVRGRETRPET